MCGIVLKRLSHNVHILEQYSSSERSSLAAGIGSFEHVRSFWKQHDLVVDQPISILSRPRRMARDGTDARLTQGVGGRH